MTSKVPSGSTESARPQVVEFTLDSETVSARASSAELFGVGSEGTLSMSGRELPLARMLALRTRPVQGALGIPGYTVGEELGRGAQGVVYRGSPQGGGEDVAIKVLRADASEEEIERFDRAVTAMEGLGDVPGIVHVLSRGRTERGSPFFTMELVKGPSLRTVMETGRLDREQMALLVGQVAHTLHEAHDRRIVHCDLKPENVLLEDVGGKVLARVADFGLMADLTRAIGDSTLNGVGTPAYMAPEQVLGGVISRRTDIHALGALLYEVISGVRPFRKPSVAAVVHAVATEMPRARIGTWSGLPEELVQVALRALAKDPNERYPTAAAFARDLARGIQGKPLGHVPSRKDRVRQPSPPGLSASTGVRRLETWRFVRGLLLGLVLGLGAALGVAAALSYGA